MVLINKNEKEHDSMSKQHQPYDSALKSLFGNEAAEILPNLLQGSEFIKPSVRPRPSGLGKFALVLVWDLSWVLDVLQRIC